MRIELDGELLEEIGQGKVEQSAKYLGVKLDPQLTWREHTQAVTGRVRAGVGALAKLWRAPTKLKRQVYSALVESHLLFALEAWGGAGAADMGKLEAAQNKAVRLAAGMTKGHTPGAYVKLGVLKLSDMIAIKSLEMAAKIRKGEKHTVNIREIDKGESRTSGYLVPRPAWSFLKTWPSYSLVQRAGKLEGEMATQGNENAKHYTLEKYKETEDDCGGENCRCKKKGAQKRKKHQ